MSTKVLIIDDESRIRSSLSGILTDENYQVLQAGNAEDGLDIVSSHKPEAVLLDIWLPRMDGLEALEKIKSLDPSIEVIMISGHGTVETAVKATKLGAYDFLEKPLSLEKVLLTIEHALEKRELESENKKLKKRISKDETFFIGESEKIKKILTDLDLIAPTNGSVMISGENGTGKEIIAKLLHEKSKRKGKPFIEVNCAAIPESLIESELFGHEKGSFTGAIASRAGKFEAADRGTIFLDEIGDMSLTTQAKLLRVLENMTIVRVGGNNNIQVDVRVISASNKDLKREVAEGNFREDLYYRLNVIPVFLPSLRERRDDIPLLAEHFLKSFCRQNGKRSKVVSPEAMEKLCQYDWPGNVRELKNIIERMVIMTRGNKIGASDVPYLGRTVIPNALSLEPVSLKEARDNFERQLIEEKLSRNQGNISKTAKELNMERSNLHKKIKQYHLADQPKSNSPN
ncbi:MAG: sigma-54-dependent transcriptional regulator [bacterium]